MVKVPVGELEERMREYSEYRLDYKLIEWFSMMCVDCDIPKRGLDG